MHAVNAAAAGLPWDEDGVRTALDMFASVGDHRGRVRLSNALGMCSYFAGRWDAAVRHYAVAEQAARQIGRDFDAAGAAANRAEVLIQQGKVDEADTAITEAIRVLVALEARSLLSFAVTIAGRVALARRDYDEASSKLGEARTLCVEMGEREDAIFVDALAAECLLGAGDPRSALNCIDSAFADVGEADEPPAAEPLLLRIQGEASCALDRPDDGRLLLHAALASARARRSPYDVEATLVALLRHDAAATPDERAAWQQEVSELRVSLGMISADGADDGTTVVTFAPAAAAPPAELS
jgi:tetratricopeptide (TPR) repeat protein